MEVSCAALRTAATRAEYSSTSSPWPLGKRNRPPAAKPWTTSFFTSCYRGLETDASGVIRSKLQT